MEVGEVVEGATMEAIAKVSKRVKGRRNRKSVTHYHLQNCVNTNLRKKPHLLLLNKMRTKKIEYIE